MASIIKKRKKNHDYYYLVESKRVDGKPRIVNQKYLGRAEDIAQAIDEYKHPANPDNSIVLEFGAVSALFDLADRLGVVNMIDQHVSKRDQGLSVGTYMLLAAINRAVAPTSKNSFADWFSKSMLDRFLPAKPSHLTSQRFWDNMGLLTDKAMKQFEKEFSEHIVKTYGLDTDCLIYDATNFFTYEAIC